MTVRNRYGVREGAGEKSISREATRGITARFLFDAIENCSSVFPIQKKMYTF